MAVWHGFLVRSRQVALGVAALTLLAAAVVASGASGGTASDRRWRLPDLGGVAAALFITLVVAGAVLTIATFRRASGAQPRRRSHLAQLIPLCIALAAVAAWGLGSGPDATGDAESEPDPAEALGGPAVDPRQPTAEAREVGLVLVLLAVGVVVAVVAARRGRTPAVDGHQPLGEQVGDLLADLAADLETEPDARQAVIRAYQRLERVLAAHGVGRRPPEAPREYLGRVLDQLTGRPTTDGVDRLTALFERAMFSHHAIDETMRADAIAALRGVGDDLRARPPAVVAS